MLIKRIKLENIRSYVSQEIEFGEGITLLSGDVGSGKSTILLAIDFALFGLRRGELSGAALLRNGCDFGSVEMEFRVNDINVAVGRKLRRAPTGILQESGFIGIDGVSEECTAMELKHKILELLGYPLDILTKKNILYRYTVYTPQEEMKLILSGEEEARVGTLRRVFNIDRYKRIINNASFVISYLKERRKEFAGAIYDLEEKKEKLGAVKSKVRELASSLRDFDVGIAEVRGRVNEKRARLKEIEGEIKRLDGLKSDLGLRRLELSNREEIIAGLRKQISNLDIEIKGLEFGSIEGVDLDRVGLRISSIIDEYKILEDRRRTVAVRLGELRARKRVSEELKEKIMSFDTCPMCEQNVTDEHKCNISSRESENVRAIEQDITGFLVEEGSISDSARRMESELEELRAKQKEFEVLKMRRSELESKKKMRGEIVGEIEAVLEKVGSLREIIMVVEKEIELLKDISNNYDEFKRQYDAVLEEERAADIKRSSAAREMEVIQGVLEELEAEIKKKEMMKNRLVHLGRVQDYIEDEFIALMDGMEKAVMMKVHTDFSSLFSEWFGILIEDESISVHLSNEFEPVIEQSGFEVDYDNLSGGEKTAAALAYRLALNQVINGMNVSVNTKDLLILDEPTDGFSSSQIDKMRFVLENLSAGQVIIVSHEPKIESFCDFVIRLVKSENETKILA